MKKLENLSEVYDAIVNLSGIVERAIEDETRSPGELIVKTVAPTLERIQRDLAALMGTL